jgi:hypothetical protein
MNMSKQRGTKIVRDYGEFSKYLYGTFQGLTFNIINEDTCLVQLDENDEMSNHESSNIYIASFITAYARIQLTTEALLPLNNRVLYHDTDSVIYVAEGDDMVMPEQLRGERLGQWENECGEVEVNGVKMIDFFTEFVCLAPKTYGLISYSGKNNVVKCKGFSMHHTNAELLTFESMKKQAEAMALETSIDDESEIVLHKDESMMVRKLMNIYVHKNKGKVIHRSYDKRAILIPEYGMDGTLKQIDTLPFGHYHLKL